MTVIVDSSVTLSWYFEDETSPYGEAVLNAVIEDGALAPFHWKAEVANGLLMGIRRQRITSDYRDRVLTELDSLAIEVDVAGHDHVWSVTGSLASDHGLTVYDAIYLEAALRLRLPLATLDRRLAQAAKAAGAAIWDTVTP